MNYKDLTVPELKKLAKDHHISKYYKMRKHEIIQELEKVSKNLEKEKSITEIKIQPVKKNPITDAKIELKAVLKKLGRTSISCTKNKFIDIFGEKTITYEFISHDSLLLIINTDEILKTFFVEKGMTFWNSVYNFLYESIYFVGEAVDYILKLDVGPPAERQIPEEKENILILEEDILDELYEDIQEEEEMKEDEQLKKDELMVGIELSSKILKTEGHEGEFALLHESEETPQFFNSRSEAMKHVQPSQFHVIKQIPQRRLDSLVKGRPLFIGRRLPSK